MLLLAAGLLAGCSGSGDEPTTGGETTPKEIRLTPNVWQVMDATAARGTRAATFDNATALQAERSFTCAVYNANATTTYISSIAVEWNDPQWEFSDGKHFWPMEGSLDFFAYMPAAETLATDAAYITGPTYTTARNPQFTCDMTKTQTKEFVWALTTGQNKAANSAGVAMNFTHPFARISFSLSPASGTHVTVNSISIDGTDFYTTGTCTFDGTNSTWSAKGGAAALGTFSIGNSYLVIPNDYGLKTITVNATWDDWSNVTKSITSGAVTINWQAGKSYTYNLTLKKEVLIVETTKYTEQW